MRVYYARLCAVDGREVSTASVCARAVLRKPCGKARSARHDGGGLARKMRMRPVGSESSGNPDPIFGSKHVVYYIHQAGINSLRVTS
jgi:hypothetical protein